MTSDTPGLGEGGVPDDARIYSCADCGTLRSKDEGGTVFTVCDECWDKHVRSRLEAAP